MVKLFFLFMAIWGVKGVIQPVDDISLVDNKTTLLTTSRHVLLEENTVSLSTATKNISVDVNNISLDDNKTILSTTLRSVLLNENTTLLSTITENILVDKNVTPSTTTTEKIFRDDISLSSSTSTSTEKNYSFYDDKALILTTIQSILVNDNGTSPSAKIKNFTLDENSTSLSTTEKNMVVIKSITLPSTTEENTLFIDDKELPSATTEESSTDSTTISSTTVEDIPSTAMSNTTIDYSSMIINSSSTSEKSIEPSNYMKPLRTTPKNIKPDNTTLMSLTTSKSMLLNYNREPHSTTMKNILLDESIPSPSISLENSLIDENTKLSLNTLKTILLNGYKSFNPSSPVTNINIGTVNIFLNNNMTLVSPSLKDISLGGNIIPSLNVKNASPDNNSLFSPTNTQSNALENDKELPSNAQKHISLKDDQKLVSTTKKSISDDNYVTPTYTISSSLPYSTRKNHSKKFDVYWNVPTFMCHRYGLNFKEVSEKFGMIQNPDDAFRGKEIVILYDPGAFPALVETRNGSIVRNNRVPQKGNIEEHLNALNKTINEQVDPNFSGLGVIDFEHWRPVFRQNWAKLDHNRNYSYKIEKEEFPSLEEKVIKRLASQKFEIFGQLFMEETIKFAKKLRPKASWGYYAFPYCFNSNPKNNNAQCSQQVIKDNDNIQWLWDQKDVLLPSIYLPFDLNYDQTVGLINGRLNEARRIANKYNPQPKILPYFWYKYHYSGDTFVKYDDLELVFQEIIIQNVDGFILWGSSNDLNSKEKCLKFHGYLNTIFGPLVKEMIDNDSKLTNEITSNEIIRKLHFYEK